MPQITPSDVVGTWTASGFVYPSGKAVVGLGVLQLQPNGTFVEGVNIGGHLASYSGVYTFDAATQHIAYQITSETGDPAANPFNKPALSSIVTAGPDSKLEVRMNNGLMFTLQSASLDKADFALPSPPAQQTSHPPARGAIAAPDDHAMVMPVFAEHSQFYSS